MYSLKTWLSHPEAGALSIGGETEQHSWGNIYEKVPPPVAPTKQRIWKLVTSLIWSEPTPATGLDLAASLPRKDVDGFSRWVASSFVPFWANYQDYRRTQKAKKRQDVGKEKGVDESVTKSREELAKDTLTKYSERKILRFTSAISTIVACLLPVIAITVLTQVDGTRNLLLCISGFAVIFAAGLIFLGTASRVEIFGATAA